MAASEEVDFQMAELELKYTRVTDDQSLEYTRNVVCEESKSKVKTLVELDQQEEEEEEEEGEEVDKIESDINMDSIKADAKVGEKVLRRSINFTKFWKKKNEKKENKNVWERAK